MDLSIGEVLNKKNVFSKKRVTGKENLGLHLPVSTHYYIFVLKTYLQIIYRNIFVFFHLSCDSDVL